MGTEPGTQLNEEPQSERGPQGLTRRGTGPGRSRPDGPQAGGLWIRKRSPPPRNRARTLRPPVAHCLPATRSRPHRPTTAGRPARRKDARSTMTMWTPVECSRRNPGRHPAVRWPRPRRRSPPHTPPRPRAATPEWDPRIKEASARPKTRNRKSRPRRRPYSRSSPPVSTRR